MAEAIGVVASLFGIAAVGVTLSKTLYVVGNKLVKADHNINRIASNLAVFAASLKHVAAVLQDSRSLHSLECEETVKTIVRECETVFQEITNLVVAAKDKDKGDSPQEPVPNNGRRRRLSVLKRARWYFEQPKAEYLLAQLEYLKSTLSVLLQTLNLATLQAHVLASQRNAEEQDVEEVVREKLHIETLIVSQQLSVNVLQELQQEADERQANPPSDPSEAELYIDQRYPKLLTQTPHSSLIMIRPGDGSLDFLDRRDSVPMEDGEPLTRTVSRSEGFIDELLRRWTRPPERELVPVRAANNDHGADLQTLRSPVESYPAAQHHIDAIKRVNSDTAPELRLHRVETIDKTDSPQSGASTPSRQWLDPSKGPPRSKKSPRSTPSPPPESSNALYPPPPQYTEEAVRNALVRTKSNPESDGGPMLQSFQDHHALNASPQWPAQQRLPRPPIGPPAVITDGFVSALAPYDPRAAFRARHAAQTSLPTRPSNYRSPHVEDWDDTPSSTDSEDSAKHARTDGSKRSRRSSTNSRHGYHDSGFADGLEIPWRIRISGTKYFDFRDDKLVGPRTPNIPNESKQWIYAQEKACTEISKKWVSEDAILEKRFPYVDLREEQEGTAIGGVEGAWRILQPLRFGDVEALVARTVDYYRQRTGTGHSPQGSLSAQPRNIPTAAQLHARQQQVRSVSFNDSLPQQHPGGPSPTLPQGAWGPQGPAYSTSYTTPPASYNPQQQQQQWRPQEWRGSRRERDMDWDGDRSRERHRERDRDYGGRHKHKHHRDRRVEEKKKTSGSSMAGTIAKIGGLAALLEGLEGAF